MLSYAAQVVLSKPRFFFGSKFICPHRSEEYHIPSLPSIMVSTRSSKRRGGEPSPRPAKRRTTSKSKGARNAKKGEQKSKDVVKPDKVATRSPTTANGKGPSYYLFKSEPESRIQNGHEMKYSIDDLAAEPHETTYWDGVRNAEARNTMKAMKTGDLGFFYHSNTKKSRPGIIGIVEVVKEAYPDHTAFDKNDPHYDPKSSKDAPKWFMVDVRLVEKFRRCITLDEIKANEQLVQMQLVKRGRISVQRVQPDEWEEVLKMAKKTSDEES